VTHIRSTYSLIRDGSANIDELDELATNGVRMGHRRTAQFVDQLFCDSKEIWRSFERFNSLALAFVFCTSFYTIQSNSFSIAQGHAERARRDGIAALIAALRQRGH
jgi:hypothetical protein